MNSTKDQYTPEGFTRVFNYREKKRGLLKFQYNMKKEDLKLDLHSDLTNSCFIELDISSITEEILYWDVYINHLMYK